MSIRRISTQRIGGNPTVYVGRKGEIFYDPTATGQLRVSDGITPGGNSIVNVTGNLTGNLTGDVTGNVTGNLTGNVTGNVTGNLTGNVTGRLTGNVTGNLTGNIVIGGNTWAFGANGALTLPPGGTILNSSGQPYVNGITSINSSVSTGLFSDASGDYTYGTLNYSYAVNGNAGQFSIEYSRPLIGGNVDINVGNTIVNGDLTLSGDIRSETGINIDINLSDSTLRRWQFGEDGALTFPDGTSQSTAGGGGGGNTLVNGAYTVSLGSTGTLTVPANGIITAPIAQEFQLQAKDANSVLRNEINLDPNNGTYMSVWRDGETSFSSAAGSWATASWNNEEGLGAARFTDAQALQDFWLTGIGNIEGVAIEASINGGARTPNVFYDGNNGETYGVFLGLDAVPPGGQGTTVAITSLVFYYRLQSKINMDVDGGEILVDAQAMDIDLRTTLNLDLRANENLNLRGLGTYPVRIYTDDNTHKWEFDNTGSLTLPPDGKINGIGAPNDRYGYISWDGDSSGDGSGYNTMRLVPDLQGLEDVDTYIILDPAYDGQTGNIHIRAGGTRDNSLANLYLGGANSHVKIGAGLNPPITVMANNKSWTFGNTGNLTFPGNLVIAGNTNVFGTNSALIQSTNLPIIAISSGANGAIATSWVEDVANIGTSNIASVYANPTVGSKIVRIAVGQNGGAGPKLWDFGTSGTTKFPDGTILAPAGNSITMQSDQYAQLMWQNANVTVAPDMAVMSNFYVAQNSATLDIVYRDGSSNQQQKSWLWNIDGMTLPEGGTITEGGGLTGAIRLTPAGGANADQALLIYPTAGGDGDHIHLTAGGGTTELYLGNDYHYVKLVDGGNVEIRATTANLSPQASWEFETTGNIDARQALGIKVPNGVPTNVAVINSTTGSWESNPNLSLATTGGSGTGLTVNVAETGGYASTIEIATAGTGYTNGDLITVTSGTSNATFTIVIAGRHSWQFGTDGNLTVPTGGNLSVSGNITGNTGGFAIGYRDIPQVVFTSNATLALTDAGKHYFSSNSANVITVPNNNTVSFSIGTAISIVQQGSANLTVTPGVDVTMYLAGNSTSSSRTVGNYGMATLLKVGTNTWFINGTGVA